MVKPLPHSPWLLLFALVQAYHSSMRMCIRCVYERLNFTVNCITQIVSVSYLMQFETRINQLCRFSEILHIATCELWKLDYYIKGNFLDALLKSATFTVCLHLCESDLAQLLVRATK